MPSPTSSSATSPGTGGPRVSWLLPAGTFVAGLALGGVLVGVGALGGEDPPTSTAADADDRGEGDGAADGAAGTDPAGLYVRVPDACVRTADDATTLVEHVDRVVAAVAGLEPERLRQTVDDVQQVRDRVRDIAEQCRAAAEQRLQDEAAAEDGAAVPPTPAS